MTKNHFLKNWLLPLLIVVAGVLAYWNSFDGVFLLDDLPSIRDNPHIRKLWPPSESMSLPLWSTGATVDGRPLLSLTFALNHAIFGPEPWGYHLVNLLIHICAGLLLFGVVRRTIRCQVSGLRSQGGNETGIAFAVALIWLVHPLQTQSVTYIVQRAESLMGMLFLMTLYCAVRGFQVSGVGCQGGGDRRNIRSAAPLLTQGQPVAPRAAQVSGLPLRCQHKVGQLCFALRRFSPQLWRVAAIVACALGMGVKKTMFSAPLIILIYDSVFISDSIRSAFRKRKRFYLALCATWAIAFGIIGATWKESTIDFVKISPWDYLCTQPMVLLHYLRLSVWPSPLVLTYGWLLEDQWQRIIFPGLAICGILAVMCRGISRRRWYGFLLAWFFLILAPTSSIAPMRQAIFEHRMYLSLAAVVVLLVLVGEAVTRNLTPSSKLRALLGGAMVAAVVIIFTASTRSRNEAYGDPITIWRDNVWHRPGSQLAHNNLGNALHALGRSSEAIAHYRKALRIDPTYEDAHRNWGIALEALGESDEAIQHYEEALRIRRGYVEARKNLANALMAVGRTEDAIPHYREVIRVRPDYTEPHNNLGNAVLALGRPGEAVTHYKQALLLSPTRAEIHYNLGRATQALGRTEEAVEHYHHALRLRPNFADAHYNLGNALVSLGRTEDAIGRYLQAVRINPDHAGAHNNLGTLYRQSGQIAKALKHCEQALRLMPDSPVAQENLRVTKEMARGMGRPEGGNLKPEGGR